MKKLLLSICLSALICVLGTACDDGGEPQKPENPPQGQESEKPTQPGQEDESEKPAQPGQEDKAETGIIPADEFFDKYLPPMSARSECFFVDDNDSKCLAINSLEELKAIMHSPVGELPEIDFDKYTLLIGQQLMSSISYSLLSHSIDVGSEQIALTLTVKDPGAYWSALGMMYYWGVHPKLPEIPIEVDIVYQK
jgi:hypothetical protein